MVIDLRFRRFFEGPSFCRERVESSASGSPSSVGAGDSRVPRVLAFVNGAVSSIAVDSPFDLGAFVGIATPFWCLTVKGKFVSLATKVGLALGPAAYSSLVVDGSRTNSRDSSTCSSCKDPLDERFFGFENLRATDFLFWRLPCGSPMFGSSFSLSSWSSRNDSSGPSTISGPA